MNFKIPMVGYTESLNLSVSAAIVRYTLASRIRNSGIDWQLQGDDLAEVKLQWIKAMVRKSDLLVQNFLKSNS
ncbi:MAG: RNA methyltransferase [Bacteroidetes bacterium]|nr:RNA methyltransferase [Bacteroidota bacterium]